MINQTGKKISQSLAVLGFIFFLKKPALAFCPVCAVAAGAGVGLSRWLGVDDTITGLWLGGALVSLIIATISWLNKKNVHWPGHSLLIAASYYLILLWPLYAQGIIGHPFNKIWGLDKLLLGIILGSIGFYLGGKYYHYDKRRRGRARFPLQKAIMPLVPLIIFSFIFYFLTK